MLATFAWRLLRLLKWAFWLAAIGYYAAFALNPDDHMNQYRHLLRWSEFWLFVLPIGAVSIGFLELAAREAAGRPRPAFGRDWV